MEAKAAKQLAAEILAENRNTTFQVDIWTRLQTRRWLQVSNAYGEDDLRAMRKEPSLNRLAALLRITYK